MDIYETIFHWDDDYSWEAEGIYLDNCYGLILENLNSENFKFDWDQTLLENFTNCCLLEEIIILSDYRRNKFGTFFLNKLKEELLNKNIDYIILEASPINHSDLEGVISFYLNNDFEIIEETNKSALMILTLN